MNKLRFTFSAAAFFIVCLFSLTNALAQSPGRQFEPSYDVVLQVLIASNSAADKSAAVPQTLSGVVKKLKNNYSFSNYRLDSTYLQRTSSNIEFKSLSNALIQNQENFTPVFSEWSLIGLKSFPDVRGTSAIQFQSFRFGQRVPIRYPGGSGVVNYEQVGINLQSFSIPANAPTVVASLSSANPAELLFLVLTVKAAE